MNKKSTKENLFTVVYAEYDTIRSHNTVARIKHISVKHISVKTSKTINQELEKHSLETSVLFVFPGWIEPLTNYNITSV